MFLNDLIISLPHHTLIDTDWYLVFEFVLHYSSTLYFIVAFTSVFTLTPLFCFIIKLLLVLIKSVMLKFKIFFTTNVVNCLLYFCFFNNSRCIITITSLFIP
jgi:hypothetical protein